MLTRAGRKSGEDGGANIGAGGGGVVDMATGGTVDMTTRGGGRGGVVIAARGRERCTVGRMDTLYVGHILSLIVQSL